MNLSNLFRQEAMKSSVFHEVAFYMVKLPLVYRHCQQTTPVSIKAVHSFKQAFPLFGVILPLHTCFLHFVVLNCLYQLPPSE